MGSDPNSCCSSRGASLIIEWPASSATSFAPSASATALPDLNGVIWSRLPATTSVGIANGSSVAR